MPCRFGYRRYDAFRPNLKSMKILTSGSQPNAMSVRIQALRRFSIESEVDEDIGKRESAECLIRFGRSFCPSSGRYLSTVHSTKKSASTCSFMADLGKYEMSYSESFTAHFAILPEVSGR